MGTHGGHLYSWLVLASYFISPFENLGGGGGGPLLFMPDITTTHVLQIQVSPQWPQSHYCLVTF